MFSKRHYEAIALVLQSCIQHADHPGREDFYNHVTEAFAQAFERDNPAFDRQRFIRACVPGANAKNRTR